MPYPEILMVNRRKVLEDAFKISVGLVLGTTSRIAFGSDKALELTPNHAAWVQLPANFTGLGYEMSSVATPGLLSPSNSRYVNLVNNLGSEGCLRVGGIVADYTKYEANGSLMADPHNTIINRARLVEFNEFLRTIGWTAIWSLNFAQSTVEEAVAEAQAVDSVLGSRLLAFELGNEVENYGRASHPFRKSPYLYETYRREFDEWRAAILRTVPGAKFAAPDTAGAIDWVEQMAQHADHDVQLLTTHYYFTSQDKGSGPELLRTDPRLESIAQRLRTASITSKIPWRICEANSFSGGGLKGVSDTLIGSLWTLDFMLALATYGCAGVNIETGVNQLGFISPYSPIQDDGHERNIAGAPYYGMLAFAIARHGCERVTNLTAPTYPTGVTSYALGSKSDVCSFVVVNRGDADVRVKTSRMGFKKGCAVRLLAPSSANLKDVTLAGSRVSESGTWAPMDIERLSQTELTIPKLSAMVLFDRGSTSCRANICVAGRQLRARRWRVDEYVSRRIQFAGWNLV
jgi:hypothetical protein